jgi:hypothetical protein
MDKIILKFIADVLYIRGAICLEEYEAILDAKSHIDLDKIADKMLREEYNQRTRVDVKELM